MGIWDKLQKSILGEKITNISGSVPSANEAVQHNSGGMDLQRIPASPSYQKKVHNRFYKAYPEKPFVSKDREMNTNWLEQADAVPKQSIIPVERMTRFSDGLLPGHVYMLYWIGKNGANKRIPSYFEYRYGIEFETEQQFLISNGYLADNQLTLKGTAAVSSHMDVIEAHSPNATSAKKAEQKYANDESIYIEQSITDYSFTVSKIYTIDNRNLMIIADCDKSKIYEGFELVNNLLGAVRKKLKIRESLSIPADEIVFNKNFRGKQYSYFQYDPLTASGRKSKYPFTLYITSRQHYEAFPEFECFGCISYLQDNRIGSVTLNFWYKNKGYHVSMGMTNDFLTVHKVERSMKGTKTTIYKK